HFYASHRFMPSAYATWQDPENRLVGIVKNTRMTWVQEGQAGRGQPCPYAGREACILTHHTIRTGIIHILPPTGRRRCTTDPGSPRWSTTHKRRSNRTSASHAPGASSPGACAFGSA